MGALKLESNSIHLWYQRLDINSSSEDISQIEKLLSIEEYEFYKKLTFEPKKHEYLLTRALVRKTLSRYLPVDPKDWTFCTNEYGRPEVRYPKIENSLSFNLSHTNGLLVCAIAPNCELGVDVEEIKTLPDLMNLAEHCFSKTEVLDLAQFSELAQIKEFYKYWTLKEAYIKARGMGLSLPIQEFTFNLEEAQNITISIGSHLDRDPYNWKFKLLSPQKNHQLALAIRSHFASEIKIVEKWGNLYELPNDDIFNITLDDAA